MKVLASGIALFIAGVAFGASIDHWYTGAGSSWGSVWTSLLIAVIAAENLRRHFISHSARGEKRAV
jgi:hypothetical protein